MVSIRRSGDMQGYINAAAHGCAGTALPDAIDCSPAIRDPECRCYRDGDKADR